MDNGIIVAVIGGVVALVSAIFTGWIALKTKRLDGRMAAEAAKFNEALMLKTKQVDEALTLKTKQMDQALEELKLWVGSYEVKMLEQRLTDYRKLWKLTEATSRRKIHTLTPQTASTLADQLTTWYYYEGGIVLSEEARDRFFAARRILETSIAQQNLTPWRRSVVKAFSSLRTALCEDMNSRRGPRLREVEDRDLELDAQIESQAD